MKQIFGLTICLLLAEIVIAQNSFNYDEWISARERSNTDPKSFFETCDTASVEGTLEYAWAMREVYSVDSAIWFLTQRSYSDKHAELLRLVYLLSAYDDLDDQTNSMELASLIYNQLRNLESLDSNIEGFASAYTGAILDENASYLQSKELLLRSRNLLDQIDEEIVQHEILDRLAGYYYRIDEIEQGTKALEVSLSLAENQGVTYKEGVSLANLALFTYHSSEYDRSLSYTKRAIDIWEQLGLYHRFPQVYNNLSLIQYWQDQEIEAYSTAELALKHALEQNTTAGAAHAYFNLGVIGYYLDYDQKAIQHFDSCIAISNRTGMAEKSLSALYQKADVLAYLEQDKKALETVLIANNLRDSLSQVNNADKLAQLQAEMDFQGLELDLEKEKRSKAEAESASQKARSASLLLTGGIILLILSLALIVQRNKSRKRLLEAEMSQLEASKDQEVAELVQTHKFEKLSATIQGEEKERDRLAKEIHDGVGGKLNGIALQLEANKEPQQLAGELRSIHDELRQIAHNISIPQFEENTLVELVRALLDNLRSLDNKEVSLVVFPNDQPLALNTKMEISVYRIIQELLNNTLKHADASRIDVQLTKLPDSFEVMVEDNGKGFNMASAKSGIGLKNIRERAQVFGGNVSIDSQLGRGTITIVNFPSSTAANQS